MEYPHISLKIENFIPSINFVSNENTFRKITIEDENLLEILSKLVNQLNLVQTDSKLNNDELYAEILSLARESVAEGINEIPGLDAETTEFEITKIVKNVLSELAPIEIPNVDINETIKNELIRNYNIDTLATVLESIYAVLILKTLLAASELGIGIFVLDDRHINSRLMEKMATELQKIDLELIIPENITS